MNIKQKVQKEIFHMEYVNNVFKKIYGFNHITYKEYDDVEHLTYITYRITGWFPGECLSKEIVRYFYHLMTIHFIFYTI